MRPFLENKALHSSRVQLFLSAGILQLFNDTLSTGET
jgi:hypothetical protein